MVTNIMDAPAFLGLHTDVAAIWVSIAQLAAIGVGLWQMNRSSHERAKQLEHQNRKLDATLEYLDAVMQRLVPETAPEPPTTG